MKPTDTPTRHLASENINDIERFQEWINRFNDDGSINVDGFSITAAAFRHFVNYNRLEGRHDQLLKQMNADHGNLSEIAAQCRELIHHVRVPQDLADAILFSYHDVFGKRQPKVAVLGAANAVGLYDFLLDIGEQDLIRAVKYVYASLYSDRAITHYIDRCVDCDGLSMPVLIEKMPGI